MTPQWTAAGFGALAAVGVVITVGALTPNRPSLSSALQRLHPPDDVNTAAHVAPLPQARWIPAPVARALFARLRLPARDLALCDLTPERFVVQKVAMAAYFAALPSALTALLAVLGLRLPLEIPVLVAVALAALGFMLPNLVLRDRVAERRAEFRRSVTAYLQLVALERRGDSGPADALHRAAKTGQDWTFVRIRAALAEARLTGITPWQALAQLAEHVGAAELTDLADIAAVAGEGGAAIADTLDAKAKALRAAQLADAIAAANTASEKLTLPGVLLALAAIVTFAYPAFERVFHASG
jgi:Flp pilus assembly protein TadB